MKSFGVSVLLLLFSTVYLARVFGREAKSPKGLGQMCDEEVFYADEPFVGKFGEDVTFSEKIDKGDVIRDICVNMTRVKTIVATYIFTSGKKEKVTTEVTTNEPAQWVCLERFSEKGVTEVVLKFVVRGYARISIFELTIVLCDKKNEVTQQTMRSRLLKKMAGLQKELDSLIKKCDERAEFIGFAARITEDFSAPVNRVIPFNQANVDMPQGVYNTITGAFTCPQEGYYYFAVTVYSTHIYNNIQLCRKRLGQNEDTCFVGAFADKAHWDQGSIQYIMQCNTGDTVFCKQVVNGFIVAVSQNGFVNAFSGFLIQSM